MRLTGLAASARTAAAVALAPHLAPARPSLRWWRLAGVFFHSPQRVDGVTERGQVAVPTVDRFGGGDFLVVRSCASDFASVPQRTGECASGSAYVVGFPAKLDFSPRHGAAQGG